jgi:hypothetical protein
MESHPGALVGIGKQRRRGKSGQHTDKKQLFNGTPPSSIHYRQNWGYS